MYTKQPKKLLIMKILDVLRRYSDADHRLSQKDIIDILQAMRFWALQYAPYVTILAPQTLVDLVKEDLKNSIEKYEGKMMQFIKEVAKDAGEAEE